MVAAPNASGLWLHPCVALHATLFRRNPGAEARERDVGDLR